MNDLINKEVNISGKEGEIVDILGCQWCLISFFNTNDGECRIHIDEINKYLIS